MGELVLKSYKKKDVDAFLLELNAEHLRAKTQKDDEIKRLFSECEHFRAECDSRDARIASLEEDYRTAMESKQREIDSLNARMGEKISAAEEAAAALIAEAEKEKARIRASAVADAESYVANAKKQADLMLARIEKLSRVCAAGQRRAEQTLTLLNKQLDDAAAEFAAIVKK